MKTDGVNIFKEEDVKDQLQTYVVRDQYLLGAIAALANKNISYLD